MSNNFFSQDDDEGEFRDIPDEVQLDASGRPVSAPDAQVRRAAPPPQAPAPAPPAKSNAQILQEQVQANADQAYEEGNAFSDEEEDFSSVLTDARFRLEQGRLYEMIMNHDIFGENSGADDKAIKYVTKQIRNFAKEQMEIMLGMRQEKPEVQALVAADFPFNDLEVQTLKALASAATKGATAAPEAQSFSGIQAPPKKVGLNTIGAGSQKKSAPALAKPAAKVPAKPLAQKPATAVKRRNDAEIEQILSEEGITMEQYNRQYNPDYSPMTKPFEQMSDAEVKERNRQIALRSTKQVKNPSAIPMPSPEQEEMLHTQRAQSAAAHPQMQNLMGLLLKQPARK